MSCYPGGIQPINSWEPLLVSTSCFFVDMHTYKGTCCTQAHGQTVESLPLPANESSSMHVHTWSYVYSICSFFPNSINRVWVESNTRLDTRLAHLQNGQSVLRVLYSWAVYGLAHSKSKSRSFSVFCCHFKWHFPRGFPSLNHYVAFIGTRCWGLWMFLFESYESASPVTWWHGMQ